eukprot:1157087-Pelagomonas_calceolata.AAC.7
MAVRSFVQVSALAPDGRCKAFAEDGDGYGRGEGFAAIMMEPLHSNTDNLQADGAPAQRVLAVYAGSAVNQVGLNFLALLFLKPMLLLQKFYAPCVSPLIRNH